MNKCMIAVVAALTLVGCAKPTEKLVTLAQDGKPVADIVVATAADRAALFAAQDLKYHLDKMTGGDFKIKTDAEPKTGFEILVGATARSQAKPADFATQQFLVEVRDDAIELIGRDQQDRPDAKKMPKVAFDAKQGAMVCANPPGFYDEQGTLYAVYEFLEFKLGVKWIDDTDVGEVIPRRPTLSVATCRERHEPFMFYRGGTFNPRSYGAQLWKRNTEGGKAFDALAWKNGADRSARKALYVIRHRGGGDAASANHSFYHFYDLYLDSKNPNFIELKPEIWAKGYEGGSSRPPQLCYTSPETKKIVIQMIRDYFDKGGFPQWKGSGVHNMGRNGGYVWGRNGFCLEPMDNGSFCQCPRCLATYDKGVPDDSRHSTQWYTFVNDIAKEIKKTHPGKKIRTLAYAGHKGLPKGLKLEDNVVVYMCVTANRTCYSSLLDRELDLMRRWHEAYPNNYLAMWLYNTFPLEIANNANFKCFPGFFAHEAQHQYQLFKKWNARAGIFHCGFNGEVENYMQLEWMLNPDRTADEMLEEFFAAYGPAKDALKEFYTIIEKRYCDKSLYPAGAVHQNVKLAWGVLGTKDVMNKLAACMAAAEQAVAKGGSEEEKTRVELWKRSVWNYMKEGYEAYAVRQAAPVPAWKAVRVKDAAGDVKKVDWARVPRTEQPLYHTGGDEPCPDLKAAVQWCYDDKFVYLAYEERGRDPSKLHDSPTISCYDTEEITLAYQTGYPARYIMSNHAGRIVGLSYGEVNMRVEVPAAESGDKSYGIRCQGDVSQKDRWTNYYAFPRSTMLNKPLVDGGMFYFNLVRVVSPDYLPGKGIYHIVSLTSHCGVHTYDRMGTVTLDKSTKPARKIRVACIGDSITYGSAMTNRTVECYPAQLQKMLGDGYEVINCGDPGSCVYLSPKAVPGDWCPHSWYKGSHSQRAYQFNPDIVVSNLGINDSGVYMGEYTQEEVGRLRIPRGLFREQYINLLKEFCKDGKQPKFIIWTKLAPLGKRHMSKGKSVGPFVMEPDLAAVAEAVKAKTLDMYTPMIPFAETAHYAKDGVHPEGGAQRVIAELTAEAIRSLQ